MVSFRERVPSFTRESATAPLKALEVLAMRMLIVGAHGQAALYVAHSEGVDHPVRSALDHGDGPGRTAAPGDEGPEGGVERRIPALSIALHLLSRARGSVGGGDGQRHPARHKYRS